MPNVAGREFPYTPEGLQAAERYRQALGMRNGGLMGFRPLGYADGGDAAAVRREARVDRAARVALELADRALLAEREPVEVGGPSPCALGSVVVRRRSTIRDKPLLGARQGPQIEVVEPADLSAECLELIARLN